MTLTDIASFIAVIGSFVSIYIVYRKLPHETHGIDASAVESYERAVTSAANRAVKLEERISHLEKITADQNDRIDALEQENSDLRDWVERLVHQVQSLGHDPVKMRKRGVSPQ